MDNRAIARIFTEIADLLEIKGENAFKIRAYRSAADTIRAWSDALAPMADRQLRDLPGIGRDLAARIRELLDTGTCQVHAALLAEFPPGLLDVLRLQGLGPKTVARLHHALGIRGLDDLEAAARAGRLRELPGMGARKEALVLRAIATRHQEAGRHLLPEMAARADALVADLRASSPGVEFAPVGSLRRGCETCGDLDILAVGPS